MAFTNIVPDKWIHKDIHYFNFLNYNLLQNTVTLNIL